jgi:peptidoglycan/LPS O-acetylase OafA/YrhL
MTIALTGQSVTRPSYNEAANFRYDIGGLRGLSIIAVVIGHVFNVIGIHIIGGVDMSFALSGYLITWLAIREFTTHNRFRLKQFYARRVRRLVPAATLVTLVTLAASWYWLPETKLRLIGSDAMWATLSGMNYWFVVDDRPYAPAGVPTEGGIEASSPFLHYWSLNVEEQFYLVYPGLLLLAMVIGRKIGKLRLTVGIMLAIMVATSLAASIIQTGVERSHPDAYYPTHTRAWELALGALVAVAQPLFKRLSQTAAALTTWVGMATIIVGLFVIYDRPLPSYNVAMPVIGTLLVIIGGEARPRFGAESILRWSPLQYIGKVSYQWYLWHWPVVIIMPYVTGHQFTSDPQKEALPLFYLFGVVGLSFTLAVATWHLLDAPIRNRKAYNEEPSKVFGHGFMLLLAAMVASTILFVSSPASTKPAAAGNGQVSEIQKLVQEGLTVTALTPEQKNGLAAASTDWEYSCINSFQSTTPKPCNYGDKNAADTVAMMGDSHTTHWVPAMDDIAKRRGFKLVTYAKSACPAEPYANTDYGTKRRYTECEKWREAVYTKVEALQPKVLILSTGLYEGIDKNVPDEQTIGDATAAVVARFTARGIKVVVFDDTPRPFIDVPACLGEHPNDVQKCTVPRDTAMHYPKVRAAREQATVKNGGQFIKLDQWFCTNEACPPIINGMNVNVDTAHVTSTYAKWLGPELEKSLATSLQ